MWVMMKRNLMVVLRDKANLLISAASAAVILGLYALFIRKFMLEAIVEYGIHSVYNGQFVDSLMLSALIIVIGATAGLGTVALYIRDKESGTVRDFLVTPVGKWRIFLGYLFTASLFSMTLMVMVMAVSVGILKGKYGVIYSLEVLGTCLAVFVVSAVLSNLLLFSAACFLKTSTSFSAFGNLYGVVIGFLTGVYIPYGYYPENIQKGVSFFPMAQTTCMMRELMTEPVMRQLEAQYPAEALEKIRQIFGVEIYVWTGGDTMEARFDLLILMIGVILLYFGILIKKKSTVWK